MRDPTIDQCVVIIAACVCVQAVCVLVLLLRELGVL